MERAIPIILVFLAFVVIPRVIKVLKERKEEEARRRHLWLSRQKNGAQLRAQRERTYDLEDIPFEEEFDRSWMGLEDSLEGDQQLSSTDDFPATPWDEEPASPPLLKESVETESLVTSLSQPSSAATAFLASEVFGPPRAIRKFHRR